MGSPSDLVEERARFHEIVAGVMVNDVKGLEGRTIRC